MLCRPMLRLMIGETLPFTGTQNKKECDMNDVSKSPWERGLGSLEAAKELSVSHPDDAASRAYYAAFYAVSAYFTLEAANSVLQAFRGICPEFQQEDGQGFSP